MTEQPPCSGFWGFCVLLLLEGIVIVGGGLVFGRRKVSVNVNVNSECERVRMCELEGCLGDAVGRPEERGQRTGGRA